MATQALFAGLVYDELGRPVTISHVGGEAHYVVDDSGFLRHISSETVDRQILNIFLEQLAENKDVAVQQALKMMGKDDLFTKAALDASLDNVSVDQILAQGIPAQARNMMGMMGFRVVINLHGDVVGMHHPTMPDDT